VDALAVLGVTVVRDGEIGTSTTVSETSNTITAYGIQVRFKYNDPTPVPVVEDSVSQSQLNQRLLTDSPRKGPLRAPSDTTTSSIYPYSTPNSHANSVFIFLQRR